jgi:SAM-dependent methyltransferase
MSPSITDYESVLKERTPASFRDPSGQLLLIDSRLIRLVNKSGAADLQAFLASATSSKFIESGHLVRTDILDRGAASTLLEESEFDSVDISEWSMILEHQVVPFPSFPYEWPPEMLHSAGLLTLDLGDSLLKEGLGLKDATPYNIVFRGPNPVFVDLLSFEKRDPNDPIWLPQAQFERTFLLPLLVNKYFGLGLDQILSVRRDGFEPEEVYRFTGILRRLLPPMLSLVSIPTWLAAGHNEDKQEIYKRKVLDNPDKSRFILQSSFKRLRRLLRKVQPVNSRRSSWSEYAINKNNYSEAHLQAKDDFVDHAISEFLPKRVLDIGCNTGKYSAMAAKRGASVIGIDTDAVVVGETWRMARSGGLDILPLVVNVSRPTPAIGWRNGECPSFLDRARGAFDAVLMLAVVHHLLVGERIPLDEIINLAAELTTNILIIEFVAPDDSMFRRLTRGRDALFSDLNPAVFEKACLRRFEIVRSQHVDHTSRWLYLLRKK